MAQLARLALLPLTLLLLPACGKKSPPTPAAQVPAAELQDVVHPKKPEQPATPEAAPFNFHQQLTLTRASGEVISGEVVRVERSIDVYGEQGWTHDPSELKLTLETDTSIKRTNWSDVRSISIELAPPEDVSCLYDSDYTPPMYQCTLKTVPTIRLADGSSYTTSMRHRWRFTLSDGESIELHLYKLPARQQTTKPDEEDYALYQALQERVLADATTTPVELRFSAP